jgi:hypothetical protein
MTFLRLLDLKNFKKSLSQEVFAALGNTVRGGPFAGMKIYQQDYWEDGNSSAKLIGCYEQELQGSLERALSRHPEMIINIGCAEGFYAVGLARLTQVVVHALDIQAQALRACNLAAQKNGVQNRVLTRLGCHNAQELNIAGPEKRLYLLDCEGQEYHLLARQACPALNHSDLIVECHDFMYAPISQTLAWRFADTHDVEYLPFIFPRLQSFPCLSTFSTANQLLASNEIRPQPSGWLVCWARGRG